MMKIILGKIHYEFLDFVKKQTDEAYPRFLELKGRWRSQNKKN